MHFSSTKSPQEIFHIIKQKAHPRCFAEMDKEKIFYWRKGNYLELTCQRFSGQLSFCCEVLLDEENPSEGETLIKGRFRENRLQRRGNKIFLLVIFLLTYLFVRSIALTLILGVVAGSFLFGSGFMLSKMFGGTGEEKVLQFIKTNLL